MDVADWLRALGLERYRQHSARTRSMPNCCPHWLPMTSGKYASPRSATGVSSWRQSPKLRMVKADRRFGTARRRCGVAAR